MTMDYGIGFTWDDNLTHNKLLAAAEEAQAVARAAEEAAEKARLASEEAEKAANEARDLAEQAKNTADSLADEIAEALRIAKEADEQANNAATAAETAQVTADGAQDAADAAQSAANNATNAAQAAKDTADAAAAAAAQNATDIAAVDNALDAHVTDKAAGVHGSATAATANTIAMRGTGGTLNVGTPTAAAHAATKAYVDAADSAVLDVAKAAAGAAESAALTAAWTGITGKPPTYPPSAHKITHVIGGNDALAPADIGAAAISHTTPVATASATGHVKPGTGMSVDAAGALSVLYGTAAGTACQGNDSRLANARTPTEHASTHNTDGSDAITSLNASVITSGTIDIARLPAGALERLKIVATDAARYALTTADVQTGDTVQVTATKIMYRVVDDSKLSTAAGYVEYTAARASAVPWSGVEGKPSDFAPAKHAATHKTGGGDALAPADIGAAAISHTTPVATASAAGHVKPGTGMSVDAAGALAVKYGTAAGTACQGNDSRLTDARTPAAHAATHKTGGSDALAPADIGAAAISHTTPVATASAAGHVKPGTGMSVDAAGALAVKYGTAAGTACQGNDSRLTDARTPASHAATHQHGGSDVLNVTTAAGTAANTPPGTGAMSVQSWLVAARNHLTWLAARFNSTGKALTAVLADTAAKWATARTLTAAGAVSGSVSIDGSDNVTLDTTLSAHAASHNPLTGSDPLTFVRYPASSTTTIYIRPGGSDANNGRSAGTAKATLQGAIIEGTKYDIRGTATMFFDIDGTVPLYPETSSGNISLSLRNAGLSDRLTMRGSGTSSSKITNNGNGAYLQAIQGLSLYIQDIAVDCRVYSTGPGSTVQFSGDILFGENAGGSTYVLTASDGQVSFSSSARVTVAAKSQNGFVYADGSSGCFRASSGCSIEFLTEQSYGVGTLRTARGGQISWDNVTIPSTSKTVTGRKYYLEGAGDSIQSAYLDTIPGTLPGHALARGYIGGIPATHASYHATGGSDAIAPADIGAQVNLGATALGGTPSTQAFGDAASAGSSTAVARADHFHKMPAAPTVSSLGAAPANATLTDATASNALPATTPSTLAALLQTTRNCLKWILDNTLRLTGGTITGNVYFKNAGGTRQTVVNYDRIKTGFIEVTDEAITTGQHSATIWFTPTRADGTKALATTYLQAATDRQINPVAGVSTQPSLRIAAGSLYMGAGGSASAMRNFATGAAARHAHWSNFAADVSDDTENAFLGADQNVYISAANNAIANSRLWVFNVSGHLVPGEDAIQDLGNATYKFRNVYGTTFQGNALTATKWAAARTLSLTGAVTGSASVDGSGNVSIATTAGSGMAATPKAASGVGQWTSVFQNLGGKTGYLPSGGTWAYAILVGTPSDGGTVRAGIKAGGAAVVISPSDTGSHVLCWRIS